MKHPVTPGATGCFVFGEVVSTTDDFDSAQSSFEIKYPDRWL